MQSKTKKDQNYRCRATLYKLLTIQTIVTHAKTNMYIDCSSAVHWQILNVSLQQVNGQLED